MSTSTSAARPSRSVSISFVEFPPFVLTWPLIAAGLVMGLLMPFTGSHIATVIWALTLSFVIVAMGFDFDMRATLITLMAFAIFGLITVLVALKWNIPIITHVMDLIGIQHWKMTRALMIGFSLIHLFFFCIMLAYRNLNYRWVVSAGKIERKQLWSDTIEYPLDQEHRCRLRYTDHMERVILLNGGDLVLRVGERGEDEVVIRRVFGSISDLDRKIEEYESVLTTQTS